jgi:hypothetical protein
MSDTNAADISAGEFDRESEAHARITLAFKAAFSIFEQEKSALEDEAARERLQSYVDGRFLGKKKGSGGRPVGGSKDGQAAGTRSRTRA